jgi:hypothetical protein
MQQFQLYVMEDGHLQVQQLKITKNRLKMYKMHKCQSLEVSKNMPKQMQQI